MLHAGMRPVAGHNSFFHQVPRCFNSVADSLANSVLDAGCTAVTFMEAGERAALCGLQEVAIEVGFDGASRGNPGPAAAGFWAEANHGGRRWHLLRGGVLLGEATTSEAALSSAYIVLLLLAKQLGLAGS